MPLVHLERVALADELVEVLRARDRELRLVGPAHAREVRRDERGGAAEDGGGDADLARRMRPGQLALSLGCGDTHMFGADCGGETCDQCAEDNLQAYRHIKRVAIQPG